MPINIQAIPLWIQAIAAGLQFLATILLLIATFTYVGKTEEIAKIASDQLQTAKEQIQKELELKTKKVKIIRHLMLREKAITTPGEEKFSTTLEQLSETPGLKGEDILWPLVSLMAEGIVELDVHENFILPRYRESEKTN